MTRSLATCFSISGNSRDTRFPPKITLHGVLIGIVTVKIMKALRPVFRNILAIACVGWLAACAPGPRPVAAVEGEPLHSIYVFSNGWHTSIVLARDAVPPGAIPEAEDFPGAAYLEFGWGDREYYPAANPTLGMALAAALTPTPAVMHIAGLARPPREIYPKAEVLVLRLSAAALGRLIAEIDGSFDRPRGGRGERVARGLYADSWFYPARGLFHLFNTCNTWTARMLSAAGVGASLSGVNTADDLMGRLRDLASVKQLIQD